MRKSEKGSSVVEFALVLPWLVALLMAVVVVPVWIMAGKLFLFAAFKGARTLAVYEEEGAVEAVGSIAPGAEIMALDADDFLHVARPKKGLALKMETRLPVSFALKKETLDLSSQGKRDKRGHPRMDNFIGYCGSRGEYRLCKP